MLIITNNVLEKSLEFCTSWRVVTTSFSWNRSFAGFVKVPL